MKVLIVLATLCLASCDDDSDSVSVVLAGGGPGSDKDTANAYAAAPGEGTPITTMASEFGYVDNPANGGNGDPGTGGNWYTGAGGQYIGGQNSTGVSLPASTEIALYGSTANAQNQPVQVIDLDTGQMVTTTIVDVGPGQSRQAQGYRADVTYGTARQLGMPVNGSAHVEVIPIQPTK